MTDCVHEWRVLPDGRMGCLACRTVAPDEDVCPECKGVGKTGFIGRYGLTCKTCDGKRVKAA